MKVGNQAHAIGLILLLVGAIAFLTMQLKSRAKTLGPAQATGPGITRADEPQKPSLGLPRTVYGDPFTHLKLPRSASSKVVAAVATPKPEHYSPTLPQINGKLGFSPVVPNLPDAVAHPATGGTISKVPAMILTGPSMTLCAVVTAPTSVAFISVDGKQPSEFRIGQTIVKGVSIVRIGEGEIGLRLPGGKRTLSMGEKLQL